MPYVQVPPPAETVARVFGDTSSVTYTCPLSTFSAANEKQTATCS